MKFLFLLFLLVPIFEIYLLITVGSLIGVIPTILLLIGTAVMGTYLLRTQGLATLQKVQTTLEQGQIPTEALLEGGFILFGGALLLTPGFLTDIAGLFCILPLSRRFLAGQIIEHLQLKYSPPPGYSRKPTIVNGEYRHEDDSL